MGLSQAALAELAELSLATVKKLESGANTNPHGDTVRRLAEALDAPVDMFVVTAQPAPNIERSRMLGTNFLRLQNMSDEQLRAADESLQALASLTDDDFQNPRKR